MFGGRYFGARHYGPRYFGKVGATAAFGSGVLKVYNGTAWVPFVSGVVISGIMLTFAAMMIGATGAHAPIIRYFGLPGDEHLVYDSNEGDGDRVQWIDADGNVVLSTGQITGLKALIQLHSNDISWLLEKHGEQAQQIQELQTQLDECCGTE